MPQLQLSPCLTAETSTGKSAEDGRGYMAEVIFSEESITHNHCQAKQGRKFFPTSAVRVRMTVQGTDHN